MIHYFNYKGEKGFLLPNVQTFTLKAFNPNSHKPQHLIAEKYNFPPVAYRLRISPFPKRAEDSTLQ